MYFNDVSILRTSDVDFGLVLLEMVLVLLSINSESLTTIVVTVFQ